MELGKNSCTKNICTGTNGKNGRTGVDEKDSG
jgi:hypothetical protein